MQIIVYVPGKLQYQIMHKSSQLTHSLGSTPDDSSQYKYNLPSKLREFSCLRMLKLLMCSLKSNQPLEMVSCSHYAFCRHTIWIEIEFEFELNLNWIWIEPELNLNWIRIVSKLNPKWIQIESKLNPNWIQIESELKAGAIYTIAINFLIALIAPVLGILIGIRRGNKILVHLCMGFTKLSCDRLGVTILSAPDFYKVVAPTAPHPIINDTSLKGNWKKISVKSKLT